MTDATVATLAVLVLGWAALSGALAHRNITGPLVFVAAGYVLANPDWGLLTVDLETATIHGVAEITLALVLFSDATRVDVHELRHDLWLPTRLLGIGLLLSVVLGAALAAGTLDGIPWGLAAFVGAALAPTDAALSVQVIEDDRIPLRLRRALNVESGLNDGIATPIVTVALAVAASQLGVVGGSTSFEAADALRELGAGVAVGLVAGTAGAALLSVAARRDWTAAGARRLGTLAVAISAFTATLAIEGNGFIAAFVAGVAFGATLDKDVIDAERASELPELGGEVLALVVWFLFGATLLPVAIEHAEARTVVYALLSLTVVRMVPVALSLVRSGLDHPSVLFVAWFGPRGLASVVFALLAVETLGDTSPAADGAVAAVTLTVLLSVVLHGVSAGPGGRRYVQRERDTPQPGPRARPSRFAADRGHPDARPRGSAPPHVDAAPAVPDNRHQPPAGETGTTP